MRLYVSTVAFFGTLGIVMCDKVEEAVVVMMRAKMRVGKKQSGRLYEACVQTSKVKRMVCSINATHYSF